MTAAEVVAECRAKGIELTAAATGLRFRAPEGALTPELKDRLRAMKAGILAALRSACQKCRKPLGYGGSCWSCEDRPCEVCGRLTNSPFMATCIVCDFTNAVPG